MNCWIDIKKACPKNSGHYLIVCENYTVSVGRFNGSCWNRPSFNAKGDFANQNGGKYPYDNFEIKYWMKLPTSPKDYE